MSDKSATFSEISPSEFFYRNRDLAGFTNPARALYMAVRELIENSFPHDEPMLIRENGRVKVVRIGEFVEAELRTGDNIEFEGKYYKRLPRNTEVLTLDEELRLTFKPLTAVFKHRSPEKLWRMTLQSGRTVTTTSSHNVFVLDENFQVISKETKSLRIGDRIIVPVSSSIEGTVTSLSILEELFGLPAALTARIVVHGLAAQYLPKLSMTQTLMSTIDGKTVSWWELRGLAAGMGSKNPGGMVTDLKRKGYVAKVGRALYRPINSRKGRKYYRISRDWVHTDSVPFNYFRQSPPVGMDASKLSFSVKQGRRRLPATLPVSRELMRILGYYASEGSISKGHKVSFSFGSHELRTHARDVVQCLTDVFGLVPNITPEHEGAVNVVVNDSTLAFLFEKIFQTGLRSGNKRVPWVVLSSSKLMIEEFLGAYVRGDGHVQSAKRNRKITIPTSSKELSVDLRFMLTLIGKHYSTSISEEKDRVIKGIATHFDRSYLTYIRQGIAPETNSVPVGGLRSELLQLSKSKKTNAFNKTVQKQWLRDNFLPEALPQSLRNFVYSDAGSLTIKSMERVDPESEWVYDVSVDGVERFVGGNAVALLHNSMDATELAGALPEVYVRILPDSANLDYPDPRLYKLSVWDNGPGVDPQHVPSAFGKVFYGSKYILRQSRGMFGLGGTMTILYGQITSNKPVKVTTSSDGKTKYSFEMLIDIAENKPVVLKRQSSDAGGATGTRVDLVLEGDYLRASQKIIDYFKQTALVASYANLTFIDPQGQLTFFERATTSMPAPPRETLPHPYGIDVEAFKRIIRLSEEENLQAFMVKRFHRVGERIAAKFLAFAGMDPGLSPRKLNNLQIVSIVDALQRYPEFLQPDASCLSPVGEDILQAGITKELNPEFSTVVVRPPSSYSGFPFLIEAGIAYGGKILQPGVKLLRFANRIPLLYDESSDVSFKVLNEEIDWRRYHVPQDSPMAVITHICSTKIPYKTVGKEYIADRPEIEREIRNAVREALRRLGIFLSRKGSMEAVQRKMNIYGKYLPLIAKFATELAGQKRSPHYRNLIGEKFVEKAESIRAETPEPEKEITVAQRKIEDYS